MHLNPDKHVRKYLTTITITFPTTPRREGQNQLLGSCPFNKLKVYIEEMDSVE